MSKWKKSKGNHEDEATGYNIKLHKEKDPTKLRKILRAKDVVEHSPAIDANGDLPTHAFVKSNDKNKFECLMTYLIHAKCDVDHKNGDGKTALHIACETNDLHSTKALIAFGANIDSTTESTNLTPLDLARAKHKSTSEITDILIKIGARRACDLSDDSEPEDDDFADWEDVSYEVSTTDDSYTRKPVFNQSYMRAVDPNELSVHLSKLNDAATSERNGDHHNGYHEERPDKLKLMSLPEEPDGKELPFGEKKRYFQTPTDSIEQGLTLQSIMQASARAAYSSSPETSLPEDINDQHTPPKALLHKGPSPKSASPLTISQLSLIEEKQEEASKEEEVEEETGENDTRVPNTDPERSRKLAEAYEQLYSPKISPGEKGVLATTTESDPTSDVSGHLSPEQDIEHKDVLPAGWMEESSSPPEHKRLINFAHIGGNEFPLLEEKTKEALAIGIEDSAGGDEGYAAWLQYREIQKAKRENDHGFMVFDDDVPKDPPQPEVRIRPPSPKPATKAEIKEDEDHPLRGCKRKVKERRFRHQPPTASVMKSLSTLNPGMEVMESMFGRCVVPIMDVLDNANGPKILCLDGGGVKGLVQIEILSKIEQLTGKPIKELFDWIVGTSTGGIIALGLVYADLKLDELRQMYFDMKDSVFKRTSKIVNYVCDTEALEDLLKRTLGSTKTMDSVKEPKVLITAVDKSTTQLPLIFFNNCFDNEYSSQLIWKVARYTSAAPVFFKECDNFVDGGVVANNPCAYALAEVQHRLKGTGSKISCVVSVGCGKYPPEPIGNTNIAECLKVRKLVTAPEKIRGMLTLLTTALTKSDDVAWQCGINCEQQGIPYYRFSPEIGEDIDTAETDNLKLCNLIISTKQMLYECNDQLDRLVKHLGISKRRRPTKHGVHVV